MATQLVGEIDISNAKIVGMTEEQVKEKFTGAVAPEDPAELFGGAKERLRISNYKYFQRDFRVSFFFKDD